MEQRKSVDRTMHSFASSASTNMSKLSSRSSLAGKIVKRCELVGPAKENFTSRVELMLHKESEKQVKLEQERMANSA
jgi:hypothetical protein